MRFSKIVLSTILLLSACESKPESKKVTQEVELLGSALLQVSAVPIGVRCVEVGAVSAGVTITPVRVTVATGGVATAQLATLPLAAVTFWADAYNEVCPATGTAFVTKKTWSANPVTKTLTLGNTARIDLTLLSYDATRVAVNFELDVEQIGAGGFSTIIYHPDGTADMVGRARTGTATTNDLRVPLRTLADVRTVAVGSFHACAILGIAPVIDNVRCWGRSTNGQAGAVGTAFVSTPVIPTLGEPAISIAVGDAHSCAALESGRVKCWGSNSNGQVGPGTIGGADVPASAPTAVSMSPLGTVAADVFAAGNTSCLISGYASTSTTQNPSGWVYCWGQNNLGQLGDGTQVDNGVARPLGTISRVVWLNVSRDTVLALTAEGTVWGWGNGGSPTFPSAIAPAAPATPVQATPKQLVGLSNIVEISGGTSRVGVGFACAMKDTGAVQCWGTGQLGELGVEGSSGSATPLTLAGLSAVQLASGVGHTCALTSDLKLFCWGANSAGVFGEGTYDSFYEPTEITGL